MGKGTFYALSGNEGGKIICSECVTAEQKSVPDNCITVEKLEEYNLECNICNRRIGGLERDGIPTEQTRAEIEAIAARVGIKTPKGDGIIEADLGEKVVVRIYKDIFVKSLPVDTLRNTAYSPNIVFEYGMLLKRGNILYRYDPTNNDWVRLSYWFAPDDDRRRQTRTFRSRKGVFAKKDCSELHWSMKKW